MNPEQTRLQEANAGTKPWRKFGPYVADRQWGTVREDYSANGDAWNFTTHDQARSRAYRWGEEALAGFCDDEQHLCFGLGLWNGQDAILKERLFGLSGPEGNHGEDVKEVYYYLDATPTHSYQRMLYKYPQHAFPYEWLVQENARRDRLKPEFELMDTAIFLENKYFDVFVEYAKADAEDVLIQLTIVNRGPAEATLHLLPQLWFRNTWAWGEDAYRPRLAATADNHIHAEHRDLGAFTLYCDEAPGLLFCENATNNGRLHNAPSTEQFFKDGINDYLLHGQAGAVNPARTGTKAAAHYELAIAAGATRVVRLRLAAPDLKTPFVDFDQTLKLRLAEADQFYQALQCDLPGADARLVQRQAFAGMLWSKQFYYYDVPRWLAGDPAFPPPPSERLEGRNSTGWVHLNNQHIISMPDTWEYPWYAAWDLAFHCLPLAQLDAQFARDQLLLLCRDWYMHPNGQLPAYEWKLSDVNPPVHAYATWRVFKMDQKVRGGHGDVKFLETIFHRLLLNFTWWVNRKDRDGRNIFEGGFLGLDNIGVFDRSAPLPFGGFLEQADGTAWVAMYALNMMRIALQLSQTNPVYQDLASKFFEHFLYIAEAMTNVANEHMDLWDDEDEFYYDALNTPDRGHELLKVRSLVGLIPMFAVEVIDEDLLKGAPEFLARMNWFLDNRPILASLVSRWQEPGKGARHLLSLLRGHRVKRLLARMLDEAEFLSPYGVRSLSRYHLEHPFIFRGTETQFTVNYEPAESQTSLFGGNSNWRGPVWMPMNFLLIESLQRFHHYYGDDFKVEYPTNSGKTVTLLEVADALTTRLTQLFLRDPETGRRACFGDDKQLQNDPNFRDYLWFHEYFHGDNGHGLGASHQTGWTGLIAKLLQTRIGV
ncbi:glucosidase [Microvirga sp. STS02]|uniref:MGH1-like glycoside hydrolase domain-containing protein n=1 Tax=Hymenobacter negativus TaxID=2795026 RepID=UPI0018DDEBA6|nr:MULTISPECIES: glucosidase [Bacteria]MBH8571111.1 glucosidase [Hymenobacter negativus]MBR7210848.1 glucosidase [Microvirga sp. STS02]